MGLPKIHQFSISLGRHFQFCWICWGPEFGWHMPEMALEASCSLSLVAVGHGQWMAMLPTTWAPIWEMGMVKSYPFPPLFKSHLASWLSIGSVDVEGGNCPSNFNVWLLGWLFLCCPSIWLTQKNAMGIETSIETKTTSHPIFDNQILDEMGHTHPPHLLMGDMWDIPRRPQLCGELWSGIVGPRGVPPATLQTTGLGEGKGTLW